MRNIRAIIRGTLHLPEYEGKSGVEPPQSKVLRTEL
jgi:hypothetical protein